MSTIARATSAGARVTSSHSPGPSVQPKMPTRPAAGSSGPSARVGALLAIASLAVFSIYTLTGRGKPAVQPYHSPIEMSCEALSAQSLILGCQQPRTATTHGSSAIGQSARLAAAQSLIEAPRSSTGNSEALVAPQPLRLAPRSPLQHFAESICCDQRLASDSKQERERRCSHRGRFRRTSTRSAVLQVAVSMLPNTAKPTFAEFGVEFADSADDFAPALKAHKYHVEIHLFDNFERGLPAAGKMDHGQAKGRAGKFAGTERQAKDRWGKYGFDPILHKGLFDDSLMAQPVPRNLIGVHSDGDLYVSINHVLIQTYRHVVPGGAIIIDDWYGGHTGVWEAARKAVYDFVIHEGVAPRLQTPVAGSSAYWYKTGADSCADCYSGVAISQTSLNKLPARDLASHKQRLQAVMEAVSTFADCSSEAVPKASDTEVFQSLLEWHRGRVAGDIAFVCDVTRSAAQTAGQKIASVHIGKDCTDAKYDQAILSWWTALPVGSAIFLECWEGSVADPSRGCRPAFYRFVQAQRIMPHLQTIYDHPVAFWIKGPHPLG